MCEWNAEDLLGQWRQRSRGDLEGLAALEFRSADDGGKATIEFKGDTFTASITAWSTGMLELKSRATDRGPTGPAPDVITEQRDASSQAEALLDRWLVLLRGFVR